MAKLAAALALGAGILIAGQYVASLDLDHDRAAGEISLLAPAAEGQTGKALHCIQPETLLSWLSQGEPVTGLDIRTPAETAIFGLAIPGHLSIPLSELFTPGNLDRIPRDRKLILLCQSGIRAGMAASALRQLGYAEVYVLGGGYQGLSRYLDPGTAYAQVASAVATGEARDQPTAPPTSPPSDAASPLTPSEPKWEPWNSIGWGRRWNPPLMALGPIAASPYRSPIWWGCRAHPHCRPSLGPRSWYPWRGRLAPPSPPPFPGPLFWMPPP